MGGKKADQEVALKMEDIDKFHEELYDIWRVKIKFRDQLHGGIPAKEEVIKGWVESKIKKGEMKMTDEEAQKLIEQTGQEVASVQEEVEAGGCVFKVDKDEGLYIEGRQVKACLKEGFVMLGFIHKDAKKRKVTKQFLQHALHVDDDVILLGVEQPHGFEESVAHVVGPRGPRACFKRNDYVEQVEIEFTVKHLKSAGLKDDDFKRVLVVTQDIGLGANRS